MDSIMPLSSIFKKASDFLSLGSELLGFGSDGSKHPPLDGEIIYCKNNVCVHPPAPLSMETEHHPGYLTLRSQNDGQTTGPTLILTWIPNSSLKKNPRSIENSPNRSEVATPKISPRRPPRPDYAKSDQALSTPSAGSSPPGSCVSLGSDVSDQNYLERMKSRPYKKQSFDNNSVNSDLSAGSREDYQSGDCLGGDNGSGESWSMLQEEIRKLSSSNKSQTDSGIGPEYSVQNNEKVISASQSTKTKTGKIGVNVNNLHESKGSNIKETLPSQGQSGAGDAIKDNRDELSSEEQLAAMMKKNKLKSKQRERTDSNKSVSIEMNGDNLVVVTEEMDQSEEVFSQDKHCVQKRNINRNSAKFDSNSSTDADEESLASTDSSISNEISSNIASRKTKTQSHDQNEIQQGVEGSIAKSNKDPADCEHSGNNSRSVPTDLSLDINKDIDMNNSHSATTPDISVTRCRMSSGSSTTTSGPDSGPPSPSMLTTPDWEGDLDSPASCASSQMSHNLTFPNNSLSAGGSCRKEKGTAKDQVCGVFSVDLGQMRSLRMFYNDAACSKGQVVIASRESQYKILHFHHGGLDKLAEIFEDWNLFAKEKNKDTDKPYKQFLIVRPQLSDDQCHPEEGCYSMVTEEEWRRHMTEAGVIEEDHQLRKHIFFGGLEPSLRHETWPFLLHYYPFNSTYEEREQLRNDRYIEYYNVRKQREMMTEEEQTQFWKKIQSIVEKDVVRTDRSHPYFRGDDNPNIDVLKNILLNYAVANPHLGYTQGMSDLLAPVLAEIQNEADAYWCFVGLMQRTLFFSSPKDTDMDRQLNYLRELFRLMLPEFYMHIKRLGQDSMELLFCHRWILLCFKREFSEKEALRIWETCWSHYQTDYFHLFLCVAIVSIYGDDVIDQCLPADEILLHFSSLALHMNGELVLRKARGLLHQFRQIPKLPCTLTGLSTMCGSGMWDSGHVPMVECVGNHSDGVCPYHSNPSTPGTPVHIGTF